MKLLPGATEKINLSEINTYSNGDFLISGSHITSTESTGLITRLSNAGNIIYQQSLRINGSSAIIEDTKVFPDGSAVIAGLLSLDSKEVFVMLLNPDMSTAWVKTIVSPESFKKVTVELYNDSLIALGASKSNSILYTSIKRSGAFNWSRLTTINGLDKVVTFGMMIWNSMAIVANISRNGQKSIALLEINQSNGVITSTHSYDAGNATTESRSLAAGCFSGRMNNLLVEKGTSGQFKVVRTINSTSARIEIKHSFLLPRNIDFTSTGAMDEANDVLGISIPQEGKLLFLKQLTDLNTVTEFTKEYSVPIGSSIQSIARSLDGGYLLGLNTVDSSHVQFIKTDSIGIIAGCDYFNINSSFQEQGSIPNFSYSSTNEVTLVNPINGNTSLNNKLLTTEFDCRQNYCPPQPLEDSCLSSYFKTFRSNSYQDAFSSYLLMRANKQMVTSERYERVSNVGIPSMNSVKTFDERGSYIKGLSLKESGKPAIFDASKTTDTTAVLTSYSIRNGTVHYSFTLIDDNLNIIWTKTINTNTPHEFGMSTQLSSIHVDAEGNYYFTECRYGVLGTPKVLIYKMDSFGNPVWAKSYTLNGRLFYTAALTTTLNSVLIFIDGSAPTNQAGNMVMRLDKQTGQLQSTFGFLNSPSGSVYKRLAHWEGDRIIYVSDTRNSGLLLGVFDTTGRAIKLRSILNSDIMRSGVVKEGKLYIANRSYVASINGYKDVLIKVDTALNIEYYHQFDWQRWGLPVGMGVDNNGSVYVGGSFFNYYTYYKDPFIRKYTSSGELGTCSYLNDIPTLNEIGLQTTPLTMVEVAQTISIVQNELQFIPDSNGQRINELLCASVSNCNTLSLIGPQSVCHLSTIYSFPVTTNNGCTLAPQWIIDTSYATLQGTSGGIGKIKFKRTGNTWIKVRINSGCTTIEDSLYVQIQNSPTTLNLGPDRSLCPDSSHITLSAGNGFVTYLWQNGSTSSSLTVSQPGLYWVQTEDACGGFLSDTIMISPSPLATFSIGPDRIKCNSDSIQLSAPLGFSNYTWGNNYQLSSISGQNVVVYPLVDTSYFVKAMTPLGCFVTDTVHIRVNHSPAINLGTDQSICSGDSVVLDAGAGFITYVWNTGVNARTYTANSVGAFDVVATTSEGCQSRDTFRVLNLFSLPVPTLDPNPELCIGTVRVLNPGAFSSYLWQDGSTNQTLPVNTPGAYNVTVTNSNGCKNADTTVITTMLLLPRGFLPQDTSICSYGMLVLKPLTPFSSYMWSTGSASSNVTISQAGTYWLQVRDAKNCVGRDSVVVNPKQCLKGLYVPTAFTPNRDGKNDFMRGLLYGDIKTYEFSIYNRWGQMVYQTNDPQKGWNGKLGDKDQETGVYVWICRYQLAGEAKMFDRGTFVLIR
jgi:gliding motility-associated-like protein